MAEHSSASRDRLQATGTAAAIALTGIAVILILRWLGAPLMALALPAAGLGTMLALARPAAVACVVLFLTGFIGTIIAHTGIPAESLARALFLCLWIAVVALYATGRANGRVWVWPGLAIPVLYLAVTAIGIFLAENRGAALAGVSSSAWYMSAFLLIAIAPWRPETIMRIVKGVVLVAAAVGLYAVFRKIVGSSADEITLARASNAVRASEPLRFFGSFLGPQQLAAWSAAAIPFLLGLALGWQGRWRGMATVGVALCTFAVFASDVRTGVAAAVAGVAVVLLLFQVCRAFKGPRLATGLVAAVCLAAVAGAGYAITISGSDASSERFENLLSPGEDPAYQERTARWGDAIDEINARPFGHGLGTAGHAGLTQNITNLAGPINLDSSYLKIGLEQGYPILVLFVVALLALLVGIARRAAASRDRWRAALGIAACGTLATEIVLFYGSTYVEGFPVLFGWMLIGLGTAPFTFVAQSDDSGDCVPESTPREAEPLRGHPAAAPG